MIIEDDIKLDYSDVLIRPKRSTLTSRFDVDLYRTYTFYHSGDEWTGIPIMSSNMDTTGTFDMHRELSPHGMITCIARLKIEMVNYGFKLNAGLTFVLCLVFLIKRY